MRYRIDNGVAVWISARDSYDWANRPGESWPCSELAGCRVFAEFDRNGLLDVRVDGREWDGDANEFNSLVSDMLASKLPEDHPCWFVVVGQFHDAAPQVRP